VSIQYKTYLRAPIEVRVNPYSLVAKAGLWYLVAGIAGAVRVYQVSWLLGVEVLDEPFERDSEFQLASFWLAWCASYEQQQRGYVARLRIAPELRPWLPLYFGMQASSLAQEGPADADGWLPLELAFESLDAARDRILRLGGAAEVLEPEALRMSIADYAGQILKRYSRASA
jgi:predicted DNA-binding transcriptional regulator YafY